MQYLISIAIVLLILALHATITFMWKIYYLWSDLVCLLEVI